MIWLDRCAVLCGLLAVLIALLLTGCITISSQDLVQVWVGECQIEADAKE